MPETTVIVPDKGIRPGKNTTVADLAYAVLVQLKPNGTEDPNEIRLPSAAGGKCYGTVMSKAGIKVGQIGDIQIEGKTRVLAGAGGLAVGQDVAATTAGAGVLAVTGNIVVGTCLRAAVAGDIAEIEFVGPVSGRVAP